MGFEDFQAIIGEVKAEWATPDRSAALNPFLLHVFAADASHLKLHVTDFQSYTWEATRSRMQLEDMRDCIGVGGPWSEFMDYFNSSLKSEDLKLILHGRSKSNEAESGSLVAQKSRGMPRFSISLAKLMGSDAGQAIANLSLKLFRELKGTKSSLVKEQERCCRLMLMNMAEQEKSQALKSQLDAPHYSKRQKLDRTTPENANLSVPVSDTSSVTGAENSPGKQKAGVEGKPSKLSNRVIPAHRRAKVRGAILIDSDED